MMFDKNQNEFPSLLHKQVWECGVIILPEEITLSDEIKSQIDVDLFDSCKQMRNFMIHSLQDIYINIEKYQIEPKKYMRLWLNMIDIDRSSRELIGDTLTISLKKWKSLIDKKIDNYYENIFESTGIKIIKSKESVMVTNSLYPKMFFAMIKMLEAVRENKEKISFDNSFICCDFRKLCPSNKNEKNKSNNDIEDKIDLLLSGEMKTAALNFINHLKENKMTPKYAGINNAWKYTYKGKPLYYIKLCNPVDEPKKWIVNPYLLNIDKYEKLIIKEELQNFIWDNVFHCINVLKGGCNSHNCSPGRNITLLDKEIKSVCKGRQPVWFFDPEEATIECIKKLIEMERQARIESSRK